MPLIRESHPFGPFIPSGVEQLIVGSFPIGKFTNPDRRSEIDPMKEIQFFYGGASNLLWKLAATLLNFDWISIEESSPDITFDVAHFLHTVSF